MANPILCDAMDRFNHLCTTILIDGVSTSVLTSSIQDDDPEPEGEEDDRGRYSTDETFAYNQVKSFVQDFFDIPSAMAGAFVNDQAEQYAEAHNGRFPQPWELYGQSDFIQTATQIPTKISLLPPQFISGSLIYTVTPTGLQSMPLELTRVPENVPRDVQERRDKLVGRIGDEGDFALQRSADITERFESFFGGEDHQGVGGVLGPQGPRLQTPIIQPDVLAAILAAGAPPAPSRGGGGGGGFVARPIDKNQVSDGIKELWRILLLEEPDNLPALINDYVGDATRFARKGGSLGLEAWTRERIRDTSRYSVLYNKKPVHIDEDRWLADFQGAARQSGIGERGVLAATEAGARAGQSLQAVAERSFRSPESRAINQGSFSQGFAKTLSGLGALGRG